MKKLLRSSISSLTAIAFAFGSLPARANPLGGQVVTGSAAITGTGTNQVTINQSSAKAIIDWRSFNISAGETTTFVQPDSNAVTLNRVTGGLGLSTINGMINANGGVYVVNPDGILFGPNAKINVGSFLGTTHDIANSDFMAGNYNFAISGNPSASIVNQGTITAANNGFAALVAPGVRNDGIINARLGTVALASGNAFTLDLYGDNLIKLQPTDAIANDVRDAATGQTMASLVQNTGTLKANGGTVTLTAVSSRKVLDSVINSSGTVEADSIATKNGLVVFGAQTAATKVAGAPTQTVKVSGKIKVIGKKPDTTGGKIQVTGENIQLASANLDASGQIGGGKILIGGDFMGGNPTAPAVAMYGQSFEATAIPTAAQVTVDAYSVLNASALTTGNGGKVVVWADNTTTFAGSLLAMGGPTGGNGGFAEVSGKSIVDYSGLKANLSAPKGLSGTILFDPMSDTIDDAEASTISNTLSNGTDVVDTADTINVNSSIFKVAGGDANLTFNINNHITFADGIVIGSSAGKLNINVNVSAVSAADYNAAILEAFTEIYNNLSAGQVSNMLQGINIPINSSTTGTTVSSFLNLFSPYFSPSFKSSAAYQQLLNNTLSPNALSFTCQASVCSQGLDPAYAASLTNSKISIGPNTQFYTYGGSFNIGTSVSNYITDSTFASPANLFLITPPCGVPVGQCGAFIGANSGNTISYLNQYTTSSNVINLVSLSTVEANGSSNLGTISIGNEASATTSTLSASNNATWSGFSSESVPGTHVTNPLIIGGYSYQTFSAAYSMLSPYGFSASQIYSLENQTEIIDYGNVYLQPGQPIGTFNNPIIVDLGARAFVGQVLNVFVGNFTGRILEHAGGDFVQQSMESQNLIPNAEEAMIANGLAKWAKSGQYIINYSTGVEYLRIQNTFYPVDVSGKPIQPYCPDARMCT